MNTFTSSSSDRATPIRGCGTRVTGGCYAETTLSAEGTDLDFFFMDPPMPVVSSDIGKVGVNLVERQGVWHILDWVGTKYYENVPDYIEELRRFGLSRRIPKNLDFSKLTNESRIILIHEKAILRGMKSLRWLKKEAGEGACTCPSLNTKDRIKHSERDVSCFYALWDVLDPGERKMPSFTYTSQGVGDKGVTYQPGIFAALPISSLVQVREDSNLENMKKSGLSVSVVQE